MVPSSPEPIGVDGNDAGFERDHADTTLPVGRSPRVNQAGVQTRSQFEDHLSRHLGLAARKSTSFVVLLIDLSTIASGDDLDAALVRLRTQMRSHEIVAWIDAKVIATLLEDCSEAQAILAVERLHEALTLVGGAPPVLRFGAAIAPLHGRASSTLLAAAEAALEQASAGKGVTFAAHRPPGENGRGTDDILAALDANEIVLALQPIVHAGTRQTAFHEGLVRIARPSGEIVMPDALVPDAEKRGIISLLDRRVIELAFGLLTSDRSLHLFVNASVISLGDPRWVDQLRTGCRLRPDAARRLTVEITETRAVADVDATRATLAALKPLGIKIAIDDFGSGHSSFRILRELPIDYLKIDGAFAQNLASSNDDRFFARALIDLARNLGVPTVAEWVEDEETASILTQWGVTFLQGHLFGRPEIAPMPTGAKRVAR